VTVRLGPSVVPILRCFDEAAARRFYVDFLEFKVVFEHRFAPDLPLYMGVEREQCELHLSWHHGDCSPGAQVRIACTDVDAWCAHLNAKMYENARPGVEEMPWGTREMRITDPFSNRLSFVQGR
jgi:uncharacterized glyoxalase superfamily protein PhnB